IVNWRKQAFALKFRLLSIRFTFEAFEGGRTISVISGVYAYSNFFHDTDGTYIGYGFPGSPDSNNRLISQWTDVFAYRVFKTENRGYVQWNTQFSWLARSSWARVNGMDIPAPTCFSHRCVTPAVRADIGAENENDLEACMFSAELPRWRPCAQEPYDEQGNSPVCRRDTKIAADVLTVSGRQPARHY
ncbi:MAG TPA: hypothetical protein VG498_21645, partial [Terriglobales bacterium]|nr:hypothetical protein [Terriglobales bacterium]